MMGAFVYAAHRSRIPPVAKVLEDAEELARAVAKSLLKGAETTPDAATRQAKADAARMLLERARRACLESKEVATGPERDRLEQVMATLDVDLRATDALIPREAAASLSPPSPPSVPPLTARVPSTAPDARLPEPPAEELKAAEREIRERYRSDYARKSPPDLLVLSRTLSRIARETKDSPASQFVLIREAAELAAQAGDAEHALAAIDRLAARFEVDALALKVDCLATVAKAARDPAEQTALAAASLALVDEAVGDDQYDAASGLALRAESAARQAKDAALLAQASARRKDVDALRAGWAAVKADVRTIETRPDDPVACLAVGRFLCLTKGDWDRGLPLLAKGADTSLRTTAGQDLSAPADAAAQLALADTWWDAAARYSAPSRARLQERAVHWYGVALAKLDGLSKIKAERRIQEWEKSAASGGGSAGGAPLDLLAWIDPEEHSVPPRSRWTLRGRSLVSAENDGSVKFARLIVPCIPPPEYDLTVVVECRKAGGPFGIGLVAGGRQLAVALDAASVSAGLFGGKESKDLATRYPGSRLAWQGAPFAEGKPSTVVCSIRRASLRVTVNGQIAIDWKTPPWAEAAPAEEWDVPHRQSLFLVARDIATYEVSRIVLQAAGGGTPRRITGPARALVTPPAR